MPEYKEGDVYTCAEQNCEVEVTVTKGCTGDKCPVTSLMCCDKPMVKKE